MGGQTAAQTSKDKNSYQTAERSQASAGHIAESSPHADILDLQHAAGNRAVSQLMQSDSNARLSTSGTKLHPLPSASISPSDVEGLPDVVRSELTGDRGEPLDPETRMLMESRFGYDLGAVRIHAGPKAAESARSVNASAYTVGRHIVFGNGHHVPGTLSGRQLLAHELSHAIQQRPGASPSPSLSPHGNSEHLAERASQAALARGTVPQPVISGVGMARQFGSHNVQELDDEELQREYELVNNRLANPVSYPERDVDKAYEQELLQEMSRKGIATTRSEPPTPAPRQAQSVEKTPEQRRSPAKKPAPAVKTPYELAEHVWTSLLAFSARATPELSRVGKSIMGYLERYDAAYASFSKRLTMAQQETAAREKWVNVIKGITIGTGMGLAAHALYHATTIVGKIAYEATAQTVKAGIGGALGGSSAPDFTPPAELNADKVARGYLEKLLEAWQALAIMQSAALAFSPLRDAFRDAASGARKTAAPKVVDELERLKAALDAADKALTTFLTTADTPLLRRGERQIEQDIWIAWMGRGSANAGSVLRDDPIGRRLDELGIIGRLFRTGEGFIGGEMVSEHARREQARMGQIGHVGVVIVPPSFSRRRGAASHGVIRLRHDAYAPVGRADPAPTGAQDYMKIIWQPGLFLRPGEVVIVSSTTADGLVVERLGPSLAVAKDERTSAFQLLRFTEAEYEPELAQGLVEGVWSALNWEMKNEPPPLQLTSSEDGVLVSEADGKKLVLFTLVTSDGLKGVRLRRDRSGASRVVAFGTLQGVAAEFQEAGVVVTAHDASVSFITNEIRAARRAVGQGRQATKR